MTTSTDDHRITSIEQLRTLYRAPSTRVQAKKVARIDEITREVLQRSPFFLLATSSGTGTCDVSPRGGPAGQLVVLDDRRIAFPDLGGNNLIDSLTNIVDNPYAGLLVLTPGRDETLRIDGGAELTTDPGILGLWDGLVRRPKVAVVITVDNAFLHCAKAFRRSSFWDSTSWGQYDESPDMVEMFMSHVGAGDEPVSAYREALEQSYVDDLTAERPE